ncbi:hypothetical protein DPEC_G00275490 [Dallia pectoralis]|uniref:Uncharacterized protein n=1 Tax=Dallia pectoralis TaxID=75939 RepID=A0ACC2FL85_DALPE|nr:hypothetical protein DPEC_G00275490 [Dallia pectoralis]
MRTPRLSETRSLSLPLTAEGTGTKGRDDERMRGGGEIMEKSEERQRNDRRKKKRTGVGMDTVGGEGSPWCHGDSSRWPNLADDASLTTAHLEPDMSESAFRDGE